MSRGCGSAASRALVGIACLAALGCIVVPLPPHDPTVAAARWLANEAGASPSRQDVLLHLGAPSLVREGESVLVYLWHDPRAIWIAGGPAPGAAAMGVIEREFALVLEFDGGGRLARHDVVSHMVSSKACTPGGLCVEDAPGTSATPAGEPGPEPGRHLVYERVPAWEGKGGPAGPGCTVSVFPYAPAVASIHLDGRFAGFSTGAGFLRLPASPGPHELAVVHRGWSGDGPLAQTLRLACPEAGSLVVVQRAAGLLKLTPGPLETVAVEQAPVRDRRYLDSLPR